MGLDNSGRHEKMSRLAGSMFRPNQGPGEEQEASGPIERVTLADVAKCLGVSAMTVSRALRGDRKVSVETTEKIRTLATKMGYRRDPLLSALSARRGRQIANRDAYTLAFITNWPTRDGWMAIPHYRAQFEGASHRASEMGYWLDHVWLRERGITQRRQSQILYHRGIKGLLFAPLLTAFGHFRLEWGHFCSVALSHSITHPPLHYATSAQFQSMRLAWHHLRHLGYRRIGLVLRRNFDARVLNQWQAAHQFEQIQISPRDRISSLITEQAATPDQLREWIVETRPDVILSIVPEHREMLADVGVKVPNEVGLALLDLTTPDGGLAGIYQRPQAIGAAAVDLLHSLIEHNETGIPQTRRGIIVEGQWIHGATVVQRRKEKREPA